VSTQVPWTEWLTSTLLLMVLWIAFSGLTAVLYGRIRQYVDWIEPAVRRRLLICLALLPMAAAACATVLVLDPLAPLLPEHCHEATGCGAHSPLHSGAAHDGWIVVLAAALILGGLALRFARAAAANWRCHALLKGLTAKRDGRGFCVVESAAPFALSAGMWKGEIFISSGLIAALEETHVQVIADHEAAHLAHRDNLIHYLVQVLFCPVSAWPARLLLRDLRDAAEQVADLAAAQASGPYVVAETLVRVHRLGLTVKTPSFAYFNPTSLERRVQELVTPSCPRPEAGVIAAYLTIMFAIANVIIGINAGHYLVEDALGWVSHVHIH